TLKRFSLTVAVLFSVAVVLMTTARRSLIDIHLTEIVWCLAVAVSILLVSPLFSVAVVVGSSPNEGTRHSVVNAVATLSLGLLGILFPLASYFVLAVFRDNASAKSSYHTALAFS